MIRKFVHANKTGESVVLWGDGSASRDFLYVDDCCEAIKTAIDVQDNPTPINIGSGRDYTMLILAEYIAKLVGYEKPIKWDHSKPNGQPRRCLDISKAADLLGFKPRTNLTVGLEATINWYLENYGG